MTKTILQNSVHSKTRLDEKGEVDEDSREPANRSELSHRLRIAVDVQTGERKSKLAHHS